MRCLMVLYLNWLGSYGKKCKNTKNGKSKKNALGDFAFLTKQKRQIQVRAGAGLAGLGQLGGGRARRWGRSGRSRFPGGATWSAHQVHHQLELNSHRDQRVTRVCQRQACRSAARTRTLNLHSSGCVPC